MVILPSNGRMVSRSSIWSPPSSVVYTCRSQRMLSMSSISSPSVARMSTSTKLPSVHIQNSGFPCHPCLMIPPSFDDDNRSIDYNMYSLAEKRVITRPQVEGLEDLMPNPIRDLRFCGSSHGWIALFNPETLDLFIYNPISLRHIILPPIHNLPCYPKDHRWVKKLILSSSPDEQSCRAVMIYNCQDGMAYCCPGHSNEWTPIDYTFLRQDFPADKDKWGGFCYLDFVYSARQNLFFGISQYNDDLETWDLTDLLSPRLFKTIKTDDDDDDDDIFLNVIRKVKYLVVADKLFSDDEDVVLLVTRYVATHVTPDGSYVEFQVTDGPYPPRMTVGFDIAVYDQDEDVLRPGLLSLGDLALFISSCSQSLALSVSQFPMLNSNSIYFTDEYMETGKFNGRVQLFGGHDIGIFNFENKTVSPCYYTRDIPNLKRIVPSPFWFFPSCCS